MTSRTDSKAEARLAYQRSSIHKLRFDQDPELAAIANETLLTMENRLAAARVSHAALLDRELAESGVIDTIVADPVVIG